MPGTVPRSDVVASRGARRWVVAVVAALVVLGVAEAGARVLGPRLEAPVVWGDRAQAVKVAQMDALAAGGCVPVVVAGNSMVRDGVVPAIVSDGLDGAGVYNAALDAAGPDLVGPWLSHQVLPRLSPGTVVLGLASADLNEASPAATAATSAYRGSPGGRSGRLARLDRAASDRSALVRHRAELRRPDLVWQAVAADRSPPPDLEDGRPVLAGILGPDGEGRSRAGLHDAGPTAPAARFAAEQLLAGFDLGADPAGGVADLVEDVRGSRPEVREVIVLLLPTTPGFGELHPGGPAQQRRAEEAVVAGAERAGAPLVDLRHVALPDGAFADTHHLNATGAAALSEALASALGELVEPGCAGGRSGP